MMTFPRGSRPRERERAVVTSERTYRLLLRAYPRELRDEYGDEMVRCFRDLCREELEGGGVGLAGLWARTLPELLSTAIKERSIVLAKSPYRAIAGVALMTALILLLLLLAMRFTDEMNWTLFDFAFAGAFIFGTGLTYVLVTRKAGNIAYRFAVGVALAAAFLLVWINLAVGIIGSEDNPANLMYGAVLAVGFIGAIIAELRPQGMARALFATALAQALVAVIALIFDLGSPWNPPGQILSLNGFFVTLFVGSALLFRSAARELTPAGAGPDG
jgi:hypothetical protein